MSMSPATICLPAHILDADISPRAREVLMLLASQTSAAEPVLWICQKTIAQRLRCSVATVARSIAKLLEAKLIVETGKLHQGKHKFYHLRWSSAENLKAVEKKIKAPVKRVTNIVNPHLPSRPREGMRDPGHKAEVTEETLYSGFSVKHGKTESPPPAPTPVAPPSTLSPSPMLKDSLIAYYAEIARQKYEENRRRYQAELLSMR